MSTLKLKNLNTDPDLPHSSRSQELRDLTRLIVVDGSDLFTGAVFTNDAVKRVLLVVNGMVQTVGNADAAYTASVVGAPVIQSAGWAAMTNSTGAPTDHPFDRTCTATNTPTSWIFTNLPAGLAQVGTTGQITGYPTEANLITGQNPTRIMVQVQAINAAGTGYAELPFDLLVPVVVYDT